MADNTGIEYCDATWNITVGCSPCSPGCASCYAARMAHRLGANPQTPQYQGLTCREYVNLHVPGHAPQSRIAFNGTVRLVPAALDTLKRWRKPRRVFVCSMGDLFHPWLPDRDIMRVLDAMRDAPQHTYLLLTKRPGYMEDTLKLWARLAHTEDLGSAPIPPNWWVGTTVCTQEEADEKLPILMDIQAKVRWTSVEPMLGAVDLTRWLGADGLSWTVCGGETGPGARPVDPIWPWDLYLQCQAAQVPFWAKRFPRLTGQWNPCTPTPRQWESVLSTHELPGGES